jgi:hypothetical protein
VSFVFISFSSTGYLLRQHLLLTMSVLHKHKSLLAISSVLRRPNLPLNISLHPRAKKLHLSLQLTGNPPPSPSHTEHKLLLTDTLTHPEHKSLIIIISTDTSCLHLKTASRIPAALLKTQWERVARRRSP